MQQDELLELLHTIIGDHFVGDSVDILEVVRSLDEGAHIEIGGYGLK